jgi:hypothetical protein
MGPYNTAKPLHTASVNLHATLVILRGATRYLHLSRRLALQIAETNPQKTATDPHAILRAAKTISELSILTMMSIFNTRFANTGNSTIGNVTRHTNPC